MHMTAVLLAPVDFDTYLHARRTQEACHSWRGVVPAPFFLCFRFFGLSFFFLLVVVSGAYRVSLCFSMLLGRGYSSVLNMLPIYFHAGLRFFFWSIDDLFGLAAKNGAYHL